MSKLHQILYARCWWSWLSPVAAFQSSVPPVLTVLWMTSSLFTVSQAKSTYGTQTVHFFVVQVEQLVGCVYVYESNF